MTKYFLATDSHGRTFFRASENRTYLYAVIYGSGPYLSNAGKGYATWSSRLDLARKSAGQFRGSYEIVVAREVTGTEFRAAQRAAKVKAGEIKAGPQLLNDVLNGKA